MKPFFLLKMLQKSPCETTARGKIKVLLCDSAGTQTQDLQNRNLTLYSTKLRSHGKDNTFAKLMLLFEITKYLCLFSVKKLQTGVGGRKVIHKFLAKIPKIYAIR